MHIPTYNSHCLLRVLSLILYFITSSVCPNLSLQIQVSEKMKKKKKDSPRGRLLFRQVWLRAVCWPERVLVTKLSTNARCQRLEKCSRSLWFPSGMAAGTVNPGIAKATCWRFWLDGGSLVPDFRFIRSLNLIAGAFGLHISFNRRLKLTYGNETTMAGAMAGCVVASSPWSSKASSSLIDGGSQAKWRELMAFRAPTANRESPPDTAPMCGALIGGRCFLAMVPLQTF